MLFACSRYLVKQESAGHYLGEVTRLKKELQSVRVKLDEVRKVAAERAREDKAAAEAEASALEDRWKLNYTQSPCVERKRDGYIIYLLTGIIKNDIWFRSLTFRRPSKFEVHADGLHIKHSYYLPGPR